MRKVRDEKNHVFVFSIPSLDVVELFKEGIQPGRTGRTKERHILLRFI
jgi:hypothetical protein